MKVKVEDVKKYDEWRSQINSTPLENIEFYENGERIFVSDDAVEKWQYIGLTNIDFIRTGAYMDGCKPQIVIVNGKEETREICK